jgi:hypothetical protein
VFWHTFGVLRSTSTSRYRTTTYKLATTSSTMNKAVEHDLLSLIPAIELPLPQELISLTISLLAQSRSKAANLKKDEEIARGYACANIACERSKDLFNEFYSAWI